MSLESSPAGGSSWKKNPVFRFFSSVKLAVVLLVVLTGASIVGTLYESSFDAKVARAYIYEARWFTIWLAALVLNLTCSALSRLPWQRKHTGFLITHLGIIMLIAGAFIGQLLGIEGTMTLFKGQPGSNLLLVDQRILKISELDSQGRTSSETSVPMEILNRKPTETRPRNAGVTPSGYEVSVIGASPVQISKAPKAVPTGGSPAVQLEIKTAMMGQTLAPWLLADETEAASYSMGLATIELKRGTAPVQTTLEEARTPEKQPNSNANPTTTPVEIREGIFVFSKLGQQISKVLAGGNSGVRIQLNGVTETSKGEVAVTTVSGTHTYAVDALIKDGVSIPNTNYRLTVTDYWPDFMLRENKPTSVSDQPNNPAILAMVSGTGVPVTSQADAAHSPHAEDAAPTTATDTTPPGTSPPRGDPSANRLTLYVDDTGAFTYTLLSRKKGISTGSLAQDQALATGWADWTVRVQQTLPHAEARSKAEPVAADASDHATDGIKVRIKKGTEVYDEWAPLDWFVDVPTQGETLRLSYEYRQEHLPIMLRVLDFEVQRNEGSDSPAGFKSSLEITTADGTIAHGQCWMNNPISFPDSIFHTFSGLTYKISQASWNPDNLAQTTVQILRDPGWFLKWIGSLCITLGIFTLFYLRPVRGMAVPADSKATPSAVAKNEKP